VRHHDPHSHDSLTNTITKSDKIQPKLTVWLLNLFILLLILMRSHDCFVDQLLMWNGGFPDPNQYIFIYGYVFVFEFGPTKGLKALLGFIWYSVPWTYARS
jgi:hypothetical protein